MSTSERCQLLKQNPGSEGKVHCKRQEGLKAAAGGIKKAKRTMESHRAQVLLSRTSWQTPQGATGKH